MKWKESIYLSLETGKIVVTGRRDSHKVPTFYWSTDKGKTVSFLFFSDGGSVTSKLFFIGNV